MPRLQNTFDRLLAAFTFFTRLPWWKIRQVDGECFRHAVDYWPFAGWITGGTMALTFAIAVQVLSVPYAILLAIIARLLLTGALHEDGLADFFDGMGGGTSRERTLQIMKDSHIGTYGVLGLIMYFLFFYNALQELPVIYLRQSVQGGFSNPILLTSTMILTADVWAKSCASLLILYLPYARQEEESKAHVIYTPMQKGWHALRILVAMLPCAALWLYMGTMPHPFLFIIPVLVVGILILYMYHRIQGYTGDCCGATFLFCEASIYLCFLLVE